MSKEKKADITYFYNANGKTLKELIENVFKNYILNKI